MTILMSQHSGFPGSAGGSTQSPRLASREQEIRKLGVFLLVGIAITFLLFLVLPFMQVLSVPIPPPLTPVRPIARPLPQEFVPPPIPDQQKPKEQELPILEEKLRVMPLDVIPTAFNPTGPNIWTDTPRSLLDAVPEIYDLSDLQHSPRAIHTIEPPYPPGPARANLAGSVVLEFIVTAQGAVTAIKVISSTHRDFEHAAATALSKWRFEPGIKDGSAVATRLRIPMQFTPAR
jgi:protein TonB